MRKSQFTESQIVQILAEYNAGASMEELARRNSVHANTIRLWRSKYAGMSASGYRQQPWFPTEGNSVEGLQSRGNSAPT